MRIEYDPYTDPEVVLRDLVDVVGVWGRTEENDPAEEELRHMFDVQRAASRYLNDRAELGRLTK